MGKRDSCHLVRRTEDIATFFYLEPALLQQILMRATLDDLTPFEDHDRVGLAEGRESVGDDDQGPPARDPSQGALDRLLCLVVDSNPLIIPIPVCSGQCQTDYGQSIVAGFVTWRCERFYSQDQVDIISGPNSLVDPL